MQMCLQNFWYRKMCTQKNLRQCKSLNVRPATVEKNVDADEASADALARSTDQSAK